MLTSLILQIHYLITTFLQGFFHFHILNKFSLTKIRTRVDLNLIISSTFEYLTFSKSRICWSKQGCQLVSRHAPIIFLIVCLCNVHRLYLFSGQPLCSYVLLFLPRCPVFPLHFADLRSKHILLISILSLFQFNLLLFFFFNFIYLFIYYYY